MVQKSFSASMKGVMELYIAGAAIGESRVPSPSEALPTGELAGPLKVIEQDGLVQRIRIVCSGEC